MLKMQAKKGILLFMVLGMILIITILAIVILNIISSQSRLTHHQVSRIQSYYAAQAGMNYTFEMLRLEDPNWPIPPPGTSYTWSLCRNGCPAPNINDASLPGSIQQVGITVSDPNLCPSSPPGVNACIRVTAIYTFQ